MRLHIGEAAPEQLASPLDRQPFRDIHVDAAAIVAPARIALGVFVGQHRALRLQHRGGDHVLRGDQLDAVLLPCQLGADRSGQFGIGLRQRRREEALQAGRGRSIVHAAPLPAMPSLATRGAWRPPSKPVPMNARRQSSATAWPISRAPSASTLALLCARLSRAEVTSCATAQRIAGFRLAAIDMPMPVPQTRTPSCTVPSATAAATRYA